jgi:hypothetical protein
MPVLSRPMRAQMVRSLRPIAPPLPESIWQCVASRLAVDSLRHLLLLSGVCRATRQALNTDHLLWIRLLKDSEAALWKAAAVSGFYRVAVSPPLHFVSLSPCPNFLHNFCRHRTAELRQYRKRALPCLDISGLAPADILDLSRHSRKRVCLQEAQRCGMCGATRHHYPFWALGMRVCKLCLKQNLVSGSALYLDYGLDFTSRGLIRSMAARVFFFEIEKKAGRVRECLSHNPADFMCPGMPGDHTFFWKPHLGKVVDLDAAARRLRLARSLVPRLTAAARALYVRLVIGNNGRPLSPISSHCFFLKSLPDAERLFIGMHLPLHPTLCLVSADDPSAARASLQRHFVAFLPRLVITLAATPVRVWSALMTLEALRLGKPAPPPYLPRMHRMSLPDVSLYLASKEQAVDTY